MQAAEITMTGTGIEDSPVMGHVRCRYRTHRIRLSGLHRSRFPLRQNLMRSARDSSRSAGWSRDSRRRGSVNGKGRENVNGNAKKSVSGRKQRSLPLSRPEHRRSRGEQEMQERTADLKARAGRLITTIRAIAEIMALVRVLTGAAAILNALREVMAGRTIDSGRIIIRRTLCPRRLSRTWRNTGKTRSADRIRTKTNAQRKI